MLSQADEEEKQKWLSKDGTDRSGVFGQDPAQMANTKGTWKIYGEAETRGAVNERMSVSTDTVDDGDDDDDDSEL